MTFHFKLFFLLSALFGQMAQAKIYIFHYEKNNEALKIAQLLEKEYKIPKSLLEIKEKNRPCEKQKENSVAHLCLDRLGELFIINFNERMLLDSYSIFRKGNQQ